MGISEEDTRITIPFCLSSIDDARKFTASKLYGIRHAWQQHFEHPIQLLAGNNFVDLPSDIDEDRLAEVAKGIIIPPETLSDATVPGRPVSPPLPEDSIEIFVLSVTNMPFVPSKEFTGNRAPTPTQKFNILVECAQPLQLGKKYQLNL